MTTITQPPTPPSIDDPENFATRADAFVAWQVVFAAELADIIGQTIPAGSAAAGTLTGATLAANVLASSLTSVGILVGATKLGILDAAGDTIYASANDTPAKLAIGTARQILRTNAGATAPGWDAQITLGTEQTSASGTSIDFTSIPAGVRRITVMLAAVSTDGSSNLLLQLGDSGGIEATGYTSGAAGISGSSVVAAVRSTIGIILTPANAVGTLLHGTLVLTMEDASDNTWAAKGNFADSGADYVMFCAGTKATSAVLDRIRITTVSGTPAFDSGVINISYE